MYLDKSFKAKTEAEAVSILQEGIDTYSKKISAAVDGVETYDLPIIITLLEISAASFRAAAGKKLCDLADDLKPAIGSAVIKYPAKGRENHEPKY